MDKSGPAFACASENGHQEGISIRDYMAGQALMGLLNNAEARIEVDLSERTNGELLAANCYYMADCMLAERNKNTNNDG